MNVPEILFLLSVALLCLVAAVTGFLVICCKSKQQKLPDSAIQDFEEFFQKMEQRCDSLEKQADKIKPKTIHISHKETCIEMERKECADRDTQTEEKNTTDGQGAKEKDKEAMTAVIEITSPSTSDKTVCIEMEIKECADKDNKTEVKTTPDEQGTKKEEQETTTTVIEITSDFVMNIPV